MSDSRMMVMVASLERHLQEERTIIQEAMFGQNAIPVGLAYPPIPANYILKLNTQCIADADYVFLLIGTEYGSLTDKGVGYIHATFANAQAARKPVVSLVYNGDKRTIDDEFDRKRLEGLIDLLKSGTVYYWHDQESLRDCTERAIEHVTEVYPAMGWIKADLQPLVPNVSHDDQSLIQKLRSQVTQLKFKLQQSNQPQTEVVELAQDNRPWVIDYQCNAFREGRLKKIEDSLSLTIPQIFEWLAPTLLSPVTEARLSAVISSKINSTVRMKAQATWQGCHAVSDIKISQNSIDDLKMRLRTLKVVAFDQHGRWQLTASGEKAALLVGSDNR